MNTTTDTAPASADVRDSECGPDCVLIDGTCRCYHGEPGVTEPEWLSRVMPPF